MEYNEPNEYSAYPDLPTFPNWLKNTLVIGFDPYDTNEPRDVLAVGIYEEFTEEKCPEGETKLTPNNQNGVPWVIKSVRGTRPWIKIRVAWQEEIEKYDIVFLANQKIPATHGERFPPYEDGTIPPFPIWIDKGVVISKEENSNGQTVLTGVGINKNSDDLWTIKSIGGNLWVSDHVSGGIELKSYDEAMLLEMHVIGGGLVESTPPQRRRPQPDLNVPRTKDYLEGEYE